jgi:hypothetical protein
MLQGWRTRVWTVGWKGWRDHRQRRGMDSVNGARATSSRGSRSSRGGANRRTRRVVRGWWKGPSVDGYLGELLAKSMSRVLRWWRGALLRLKCRSNASWLRTNGALPSGRISLLGRCNLLDPLARTRLVRDVRRRRGCWRGESGSLNWMSRLDLLSVLHLRRTVGSNIR